MMNRNQRKPLSGRFASSIATPALCGGMILQVACSDAHTSNLALSTRGLYREIGRKQVMSNLIEYQPDYALWSDGAQKRRWLSIPAGEQIDTSDMDHWEFPVGTKVWKEFSLHGRLLETRLVERVAESGRFEQDYKLATYVWDEAQTDAHELESGVQNVLSTEHNVPAQKLCRECHRGEPGAILGVSALQASRSGLLDELSDRDLLSVPPGRTFQLPGDEVTAAAIGYLHANCGHCHSDTGQSSSDMRLHVSVDEVDQDVESSALYLTTLDTPITEWKGHPADFERRVVPGDPEQSAVYFRMSQRGGEEPIPDQMPPLASELRDEDGLDAVRAWITSLAHSE
jgi:hypothetical protein